MQLVVHMILSNEVALLSKCDGFIGMQLTEIPFCDFKHLGVVKVAQIGLAKLEVSKKIVKKKKIVDI